MISNNASNNKKFFLVVGAILLAQTASVMLFIFTPSAIGKEGDISITTQIMLLSLVPSPIFAILGGWASDFLGRVRTLTIWIVLGIANSCFAIFNPNWQTTLTAYLFSEITKVVIWIVFWVYVVENAPLKNRGAFVGAIFGVELFFNSKVEQFLSALIRNFGENAPQVAGSLILAFTLPLLIWASFQSKDMRTVLDSTLKNSSSTDTLNIFSWLLVIKTAIQIGLVGLALNFIGNTFQDSIKVMFEQKHNLVFFEVTTYQPLIIIIAMIASGYVSDRFGEHKTTALILVLAGAGGALQFMALNYLPDSFSQIFIFGLCGALLVPPLASFTSKILPDDKRGLTLGIWIGASTMVASAILPFQAASSISGPIKLPSIIAFLAIVAVIAYLKLRVPIAKEETFPEQSSY